MHTIKGLRKEKWYTQKETAEMIGIHRITYNLSEKGERTRKEEELERLSEIFDVSIDVLTGHAILPDKPSNNPDLDQKVFENVLLYILNQVGIKPNIGKTVLYKLLYFSDFNHYEKHRSSITWSNYIRLPMWPALYNFDMLVHDMVKEDKILVTDQHYMWYYQKKYFPNKIVKWDDLSATARAIIDEVLADYSDMGASEISDFSHWDIPRQQTKDMEIIDYTLARQRTYPYSVLAREKKKQEAFAQIQKSNIFSDIEQESDAYEKYR